MSRPRVLLADDHQIVAEGLRGLLEPEFELVGIVADGRELVAAARRHRPDVIITDISMPSLNGIDAALQLKEAGVSAKVVFLTMHHDVAYARRALEAGAAGFVLKHAAPAELLTALREALQGRTSVSPRIAGELLESYRESAPRQQGPNGARPLTRRRGVRVVPARMLLSHLIKRRPLLSLEQIETAHRLVEAALIERGHDPGKRHPGRARAWSAKATPTARR